MALRQLFKNTAEKIERRSMYTNFEVHVLQSSNIAHCQSNSGIW